MRRWTTATSIEVIRDDIVVAKRWIPVHPTGATLETPLTEAYPIDPDVQGLIESEACWLLAARGARVVTVRRVDPTSGVLATGFAGPHTLRTFRHRPPAAAAVLAAVATTLGELHRRGLVHGNLTLDHVLLSGEDLVGPLLCSPAVEQERELPPASDVLGLGKLAERVGPTAGRQGRRWRRVTTHLRRDAHRLGAHTAAELFADLGGNRFSRRTTARRRNGRG